MTVAIKLAAYGLGAIGFFLAIGGVFFLNKGIDPLFFKLVNATAIDLGNGSSTIDMGWSLIGLGIFVAVLGVTLSIIRQKI